MDPPTLPSDRDRIELFRNSLQPSALERARSLVVPKASKNDNEDQATRDFWARHASLLNDAWFMWFMMEAWLNAVANLTADDGSIAQRGTNFVCPFFMLVRLELTEVVTRCQNSIYPHWRALRPSLDSCSKI